MKESINNCKCIEKLMIIGKVESYNGYNELSDYVDSYDVEEGTLCLTHDIVVDNGDYEDITWVSNIDITRKLYPINYCPICGKEIEYQKIKSLNL